jgi:predicted metal-dependent phosphotriesterase family hydrolase
VTRRDVVRRLGETAGFGVAAAVANRVCAAAPQRPFASTSRLQFPKGAIIRLQVRDERPERLGGGAFLWHEHPTSSGRLVSPPGAVMSDDDQLNLMVDELKAAQFDGVGCIFDTTHKRRTSKELQYTRELATRSGLPYGICGARDVTRDAWWNDARDKGEARVVQELAEDMTREATEQRWAAIGEIGTSLPTSELDRWYLKGVAQAQLRTNLRIYTHTPPEGCPSCALEQLAIFESQGVDPRHVCIGHLGDFQLAQDPGWATHKTIAKRGAYIGFDSFGAPLDLASVKHEVTSAEKVRMVLQLLEAGYEDQILFSGDLFKDKDLKANYGAGFSAPLTMFFPKLRYAGVSESVIRKMAVDNPRRFFAFVPKNG